jgi:hypothetical protein
VHGKDAAEPKNGSENRVLEESGLSQEMEGALRRGSEEERVEKHVGMIRSEDHGSCGREALGMLDPEAAMEKVSERPRQGPHHAIQNGLGHESKYRASGLLAGPDVESRF